VADRPSAASTPADELGLKVEHYVAFFQKVFTSPRSVLLEQRSKASLSKAMLFYSIAGASYVFLSSLLSFNLIGLIFGTLVGAVVLPLFAMVGAFLIFACARMIGGRGSLTEQAYLVSLVDVPIFIAFAATMGIPPFIPFIGVVLGPLATLGLVLYHFYLLGFIVKHVHGLGTARTLMAILVPFAILFFVLFVLALLISLVALAALGPVLGSLG
jgi:hypothetical protein